MPKTFVAHCIAAAHSANAQGKYEAAIDWCRQALQLAPALPEAFFNLGIAYAGRGRLAEAKAAWVKASKLTQGNADAQNSLGMCLMDIDARDLAERCFKQAIKLSPDFAYPHSNLGKLRFAQKRLGEAEASFRRALALDPGLAVVNSNLAGLLNELKRPSEALEYCTQAVALAPDLSEAYNNLGNALLQLNRFEEALAGFDKAIALTPKNADACFNRGNVLAKLGRPNEALASYNNVLALTPDSADAYLNCGTVLTKLKRLDEALANYSKALELKPDHKYLYGTCMHTRMYLCDWADFQVAVDRLVRDISAGVPVITPFALLSLIDSPKLQHKCAEAYAKNEYPEQHALGPIPVREKGSKIRIGYYSADYKEHPVSYLMAGVFESHDKDRFELIGFSLGQDIADPNRQRALAAFDQFIDVRGMSDRTVAELSRDLGIDIAVDLNGYTEGCRTGIFAFRAAPVQVNYLGYPGTSGARFFDYIVADSTVIDVRLQPSYTEKVAYLPHHYLANGASRSFSDRKFSRTELGLPEAGFVFCCFNNNYKILPETFAGWMRILKKVDDSVLWLFETNPEARRNLRMAAEQLGVCAERLVFAPRVPLFSEHLGRLRSADLFLDTLPYNAHTTASDALWAGLPVLTRMGESFAGRVAASLLNAMDLSDLITTSQQDYEDLAVELATNPEKFDTLKQRLAQNRLNSPVFDTPRFTRNLEAAYQAIYERYYAGLPPQHIYIEDVEG